MQIKWLIPIAIAAAACVPCILLVLYLVFRNTPGSVDAKQSPDTPDLLAEREDAEFIAAAEALRNRAVEDIVKRERDESKAAAEEIDWSEPDVPFRPSSIDPNALYAQLKITKPPKLVLRSNYVFIKRAALEKVEEHLRSNTSVELGGLLVGLPYYATSVDSYLVVVHDGYAADEGKETAISFEYTADTWKRMTPQLQEMPPEYVVVGSYHSHPDIGVFLSSTDINTQVTVFSQPWQLALVIDPIRNQTGFFISPEGVPVDYQTF